jgi:hypothetical protein
MRYLIVVSTVAIALVATAAASAGGWATVGLEPSVPAGVGPGDPWDTEMTVLQHGVRPLDGLTPTITITSDDTGESRQFVAAPAGKAGVYKARVVFPEAGAWRILADSTFGESTLTYGPVTIGPDAGTTPSSFPVLPAVAAGVALALAAAAVLGTLGIRRSRRLSPASQ